MYIEKCDICDSTKNIVAGRWIFYCQKHKQVDIDKTYDNEIEPCLISGEMPEPEALEAIL